MTGYFSPDLSRKAAQGVLVCSQRRRAFARTLRFGAPMVSLSALIWAAPALAQTTITNETTAPLATSTAGDVIVNAGGTIRPASGTAVTIDSNNSLSNTGVIAFTNLDNVTGVKAIGGHTGSITNNGSIQVDEAFTSPTDDNGVPHGVFAKGTNRFGIRVIGPGDFTGDVINGSLGSGITIKGENSYAISIETNLVGALNNGGVINLTGDNSTAIRTTGKVSGNVTLGGTINGAGQGVQGANLGGDIGGQLLINGTVTTSGYRFTTRSTDPNFLKNLKADDLLQSDASVSVGGNVAKGVLVDTTAVDSTGAVTGTTGASSSNSSAPAQVVGGLGRDVTHGNVGTGADAIGREI
jgi:hypothetical protein